MAEVPAKASSQQAAQVYDGALALALAVEGRALRAIAVFEAFKGLLALAALLGLLKLLHRDLHVLALTLIGRLGLDPEARLPTLVLHQADVLQSVSPGLLAGLGLAYVAVRWAEAWGLWRKQRWGEWLGALSGALYLPFEVRHLLHKPGLLAAAVLLLNLTVVLFLAWELRQHRRPEPPG